MQHQSSVCRPIRYKADQTALYPIHSTQWSRQAVASLFVVKLAMVTFRPSSSRTITYHHLWIFSIVIVFISSSSVFLVVCAGRAPLPVPVGVVPRRFVRGTAVAVLGIFTPALLEVLSGLTWSLERPYRIRGSLALPARVYYHIRDQKSSTFCKFLKKTFVRTNTHFRFNTLAHKSTIDKKDPVQSTGLWTFVHVGFQVPSVPRHPVKSGSYQLGTVQDAHFTSLSVLREQLALSAFAVAASRTLWYEG